MTDKQIIIDGVDVSGCERHCSDNRNNPNMCYSEMTRTYSNCNPKEKQCNFYITSIEKQLKRKEQECEKLKENLSDLKKDLKFQNDKISEIELDLQNANNTIENLDLMRVGEYNALVDDYNKLKQTLAEIKEIIHFNKTNRLSGGACISIEQILQKISEVENEHIK